MCKTYISAIGYVSKTYLQNKGGGEKHHKYVGFRYVIRVFLMIFFSALTYLS